jgi:quercetin dioxygenase-like cupin family protein
MAVYLEWTVTKHPSRAPEALRICLGNSRNFPWKRVGHAEGRMNEMPKTANLNNMLWTVVRSGIERKAFSSEGGTLSYNRLFPGHAPQPHSHAHEQIVYIVEGEMDFHIGGEVLQLIAGSLVVVPPHVIHYAVVTGDTPVINIDFFTPLREDYPDSEPVT